MPFHLLRRMDTGKAADDTAWSLLQDIAPWRCRDILSRRSEQCDVADDDLTADIVPCGESGCGERALRGCKIGQQGRSSFV